MDKDFIELVTEVLLNSKEFNKDQLEITKVGLSWVQLILKKNNDYGSAVFNSPVLIPDLDPEKAIRVRMSDKIQRLMHLVGKDLLVKNESIEDTLDDLGAYILLRKCLKKIEKI